MYSLLMRSTCLLAVALAAETTAASPAQAQGDQKARCSQLVSYYNRYGTSRGEDTDGNRNFIKIGAELDCQSGQYDRGIAALEGLMKGKNWAVPPPPRS